MQKWFEQSTELLSVLEIDSFLSWDSSAQMMVVEKGRKTKSWMLVLGTCSFARFLEVHPRRVCSRRTRSLSATPAADRTHLCPDPALILASSPLI